MKNKYQLYLKFIFRSVFLLGIAIASAPSFAITVSGSLKLPAGFVPARDIPLNVRLIDTTGTIITRPLQSVVIPAGSDDMDSFPFSLDSGESNSAAMWRLDYQCSGFPDIKLTSCPDIVGWMFYESSNINGSVTYKRDDSDLLAGDGAFTNVDMTVARGRPVDGALFLPAATAAPADGLTFSIRAKPSTVGVDFQTIGSNILEQPNTSETFRISLPDDATESWILSYRCFEPADADCNAYLEEGFYATAATNSTVDDINSADSLTGGSNYSGKNLTLLTGYTLSGSLNLPSDSSLAPGENLTASVEAIDVNNISNRFTTSTTITGPATSENFSIAIPTTDTDWNVRYDCAAQTTISCNDYIELGYYNSGATNSTVAAGEVYTDIPGQQSTSSIDLTLLTGPTITGTLQLSTGVAPEGGLNFRITADDTTNSDVYASIVAIEEGESSVNFSITVLNTNTGTFRVSYDCSEFIDEACRDYVDIGYYDSVSESTVVEEDQATPLSGNPLGYTNIIMTVSLLPGDELCFPIVAAGGSPVVCL